MTRSSLAPRWLSSLVLCLAAAGCSSEPASPAEASAQIALPIAREKPAPADALWSPAATPYGPVRLPTATLLPSGQVLIAGGVGDGGFTLFYQKSPLYDPSTNAWIGVPSMTTARANHTATLLADGRVLAAGGENDPAKSMSSYDTSEIYDPAAFTWTAAGLLKNGRQGHAATRLLSGKVLITGGHAGFAAMKSAEIFDPATSQWTLAAPMLAARAHHAATRIPNGNVLVAGCQDPGGVSAEIYHPITNTWTAAAPMLQDACAGNAMLLANGKVLLTGTGKSNGEIYDPATNSWSLIAPMIHPRDETTATLLPSGQVLLEGGYDSNQNTDALASVELYDPPTNTWSETTPMSEARAEHTATLLPDGEVLVVGGIHLFVLWSAELYSLEALPLLGSPCAMGSECQSGFCADGVCCNTTCAEGPCDACTVALGAVADGTCTLLEGAACPGGMCSAGACSLSADGGIGGASASSTSTSASSAGGGTSSGVTGAGGGASSSVGGSGGGASSGVTGAGESSNSSGPSGGCGCRMATGDQEPSPAWLLFAAAVVVLRRRRDSDDRQSGSRPGGA